MLSNLLTVTGQVATLFLMMAVGFVLGRAGKITEAGRSQMSYLLLYIVCPCVMVDCFLVKRTPALTQEVAVGSAAALACYLLFFAVSLLFFRRQRRMPGTPCVLLRSTATSASWGSPWSSPSSGRRRWSTARWPCWPST